MGTGGTLDRVPFVAIELDAGLVIRGWNERAAALFAANAEAALGRTIMEVLPIAGGEAAWRAHLAQPEGPHVWSIARPDAPALRFEAWTQATGEGHAIYGHDVTARDAIDQQRKLDSMLLDAIKSNLDLALWALDRQGTFLYQAGKAVRAAGLAEGQFVGQCMFDLYKGSAQVETVQRAIAGEAVHEPPNETHGLFWENWYLPVGGADHDVAVVGVSLDVSEARRREQELLAKIEVIEQQQEVIRELSTPIIEVWDGVLTLPIVGLVDSVRTAEIMDNLLQAVSKTGASFAILDLTGVQVVDTGTASHLIGLVRSIRLLGAEGVLTGISPEIAQTVVALGVDLSHVAVFAKLRNALKYCITKMNQRH